MRNIGPPCVPLKRKGFHPNLYAEDTTSDLPSSVNWKYMSLLDRKSMSAIDWGSTCKRSVPYAGTQNAPPVTGARNSLVLRFLNLLRLLRHENEPLTSCSSKFGDIYTGSKQRAPCAPGGAPLFLTETAPLRIKPLHF